MVKGTPSFGRKQKITHIRCRRCGRHSYNIRDKHCSACGFPNPKMYHFSWRNKTIQGKRKKRKPRHMKPKTARLGR